MKTENNIPLTKVEKLYLIVYCIMALCSIGLLFRPQCQHDSTEMNFEKAQSEKLIDHVNLEKEKYEKEISHLEKSNFVLKKLLKDAESQLKIAVANSQILKAKVYYFANSVNDSTRNSDCDSLSEYSISYIKASENKDSIYNYEISLLNEIVENRDSVFFSCKRTMNEIDSSFQLLAKRHSQLADQLLVTQKNLRHAKRNARIWSGASLLLSGVTITLWMKNQ
jgi:hypothetical protein